MGFPDKYIRGISSMEYIDEEGRVSAEIFQFSNKRNDGFYESSINWYDEEAALHLILEKLKDDGSGNVQFKFGAAVCNRCDADHIIAKPAYSSVFNYERAPIDGNKYHGNLLRKDDAFKNRGFKNAIPAYLAMNAHIIPRDKANSS
jgi:hypothetical protein